MHFINATAFTIAAIVRTHVSTKVLLPVFCLLLPLLTSAQFSRSEESKAASIYTILINTKWENQAGFQEFEIGVLDNDTTLCNALRRKYNGVKIKGKPVKIYHFKAIEAIWGSPEVLCVDRKFNKKIDKVAAAVPAKGTLLITDNCGKEKYTMVDFNGRLQKEDFDVNQENMAKAGLKLTQEFEEYVTTGDNGNWQELLDESSKKLTQEQAKVALKEKTISAQKAKINYQQMTLEEKVKMLDEQSGLLENQAKQLEAQDNTIAEQKDVLKGQRSKIREQEGILIRQLKEIGMQRVILTLFMIVIALIVIIAYVLYRSYYQKKNSVKQLSEQNLIVSAQKEQIEKILFELTASIRYAYRIQNAVLPKEQSIRKHIPGDYFVLYQPKDIVSGDFFFVDQRNDWTLVAVADCTGHGVPGAFVSMLCISLLNEIVRQQEVLKASIILNELREKVINSLQQRGIQGEQMDGMDISLLLINAKTLQCQWSGANNPLYLVSSNKLKEFKPDKRPISIYPDMQEFTNHDIKVKKGDMLYLFTDGYPDQFGGAKGKKFMSKNFKSLIAENAHRTMEEQNQVLHSTMEEWKNTDEVTYEQIDDITVLGIRIA